MKSKKMAIAGVTAGLLAGAGAGFVLNLPGGASAEKSSVVVQAAAATDDDSTSGAPAGSINGGAMDDGDMHAEHHGNREDHVREALQPLVDDGTLTAAELDAVVTALGTRPSTPPTPPADGSMPDPSTRIKERLQSLVDDGTLSASDLDKVAAALVAAMPADGGRGGHGGHDHGGRGRMGGRLLEPAATAIGITVDELKTELQAGKTIAEVAVANGKTAQQVIDALVDEATADITQRITDMVNGVEPTPPSTTGA